MKTYIKPEIIAADMESCSMVAQTGVTSEKTLGKSTVSDGAFYSKEDKGWDDWNE